MLYFQVLNLFLDHVEFSPSGRATPLDLGPACSRHVKRYVLEAMVEPQH